MLTWVILRNYFVYTRVVPLCILMAWNHCNHFAKYCRYFHACDMINILANAKHFSAHPVWDYLHSQYIIWWRMLFSIEYFPYLKYCTRQYSSWVKHWLISKWSPASRLFEFWNRMSVIIAYKKGYRLQKGWLLITC